MVPRPDMVTMPATATVADALDVVIRQGFSRLPVVGTDLDDIVGVAHAKDLIKAEREGRAGDPLSSLARAARFVPETKAVATLMREMQVEGVHMALIVDEYGGTAGLVTLEDLIEELVGDIVDEFDDEDADVVQEPDGALQVSAGLPVHDLNELLGTALPDEDWDSVGGLVVGRLGRVPQVGEAVELDGFRFEATGVEGHRVSQVRVRALPPPPPTDADAAAGAPA
jgi:CBS domain containing-hemolysin-like protein